jgi:cellulase/cellobiase CelA1
MTLKFIRFAHWQVWLTVAATLISLTAAVRPATAATGVTCSYTVTNTWPNGFMANVDITNNGPVINGWTLQWTFRTPTSLGAIWSAGLTEQDGGKAVATNTSWNGTIPTGQVTSFGWTASAASTTVPTDLTINGQPC